MALYFDLEGVVMKIVFDNATILCDKDFEELRGYIVVEKGVIKKIGEGKSPYKSAINVKGGIIFPSFTNAHTHLGDSIAKDAGAYESIEKRVGEKGIKFEVLKKYEKGVKNGIRHSLKEMPGYGTTSFCDFREMGLQGIEQLKAVLKDIEGIILGRPNGNNISEVLNICDGIGISNTNDYSFEELKKISELVKKEKKLLGMHVAEVKDDVEIALKLKPDFMVHLTNASEESLEKVFRARVPIVICPRANAMLGVGLPNLKGIFENSLVALGTDNVMVNSLNMFREMEFAFKLMRGLYKDYKFGAEVVLKAATLKGREILGLESNEIKEGNKADFVVVKRRKYIYDPAIALVHRTESRDIKYVVNGRVIFRGMA